MKTGHRQTLQMKPVSIIVATARGGVIGQGGRLPWSIPEDWRYFLEMTRGGVLVIGRVAFEEMQAAGQAGPERYWLVVSRQRELAGPGVEVWPDLPAALGRAQRLPNPIWIAGGVRIYAEALPLADRLYLTEIEADVEGDVFFPEWREHFQREIVRQASSHENWRYTFRTIARR